MAVDKTMNLAPDTLDSGLRELEQLAQDEYGRGVQSLLQGLERDGSERMYFGRLLGILTKKPFSKPEATPELQGTKRRWEIVPETLAEPAVQGTWQFRVLALLQQESLEYQQESFSNTQAMILEIKRETGFFWHLLRSLRKHVCGDPKFSADLEKSIREAETAGYRVQTLTGSAAAAGIASALASQVPWLGIAGPALTAGVLLLVWTIGLDAFCSWSDQQIKSRVWYRDS